MHDCQRLSRDFDGELNNPFMAGLGFYVPFTTLALGAMEAYY